jgi:hypothetical protein
MDPLTIKSYKPDDPIPDVFNAYSIGHIITQPDGRRWRRGMFGEWDLVVPSDNDLTLAP